MDLRLPQRRRAFLLDTALALALTVALGAEVLLVGSVAGRRELVLPLFLFQAVPLVWRRTLPLLVALLVVGSARLRPAATRYSLFSPARILDAAHRGAGLSWC